MNSSTFIVRPGNKDIVFIRTDSGRIFKISNRKIKTDGHIDENNGLIPNAVEVSATYVADLVAIFEVKPRPGVKGKASRIRRVRKEEVV